MADINEGTLVKIVAKAIVNVRSMRGERPVPFTKFEMIPKGTSESEMFVFPMYLDLQLEHQVVRFKEFGSGLLDGQTRYLLEVIEGKNQGLIYDSGSVPIYDEESILIFTYQKL